MDSICPFFLSLDYYTRLTLAFSKAKLSLNDEGAICRALEPKIQRGVRDLFWERRPQFPPSAFKYVTLGGVGHGLEQGVHWGDVLPGARNLPGKAKVSLAAVLSNPHTMLSSPIHLTLLS